MDRVPRQDSGASATLTHPPGGLPLHPGSARLAGKVALITGGDGDIGRAVAARFAREGADIALIYTHRADYAAETCRLIEAEGRRCLLLCCDIREQGFCHAAIRRTVSVLGGIDILVNNAVRHGTGDGIRDTRLDQMREAFEANVFNYIGLVQAALSELSSGGAIVNTISVTAQPGQESLTDHVATCAAVSLTRSLASELRGEGIRVNAVAPGALQRLFSATADDEGAGALRGRPCEVAGCALFLASEDSAHLNGQTLHPHQGRFLASA